MDINKQKLDLNKVVSQKELEIYQNALNKVN